MSFALRDATTADTPSITAIYRESVLNGVASYEMTPPDEAEMASRFSAITDGGYPYIAAVDASGALLGYAYASAFRTRAAYRFLVEDSIYLAPDARGRGAGKACFSGIAPLSASGRWSPSSAARIPRPLRSTALLVSSMAA